MIINSSNLKWLEEQPDESVHHIITDPPYLIDFMGAATGWDKPDNIAGRKEFWEECLRVLKPGGHLLVFGHSRTHHRVMCAIEDAGAQIRDCLFWFYGSGFPKSQDIGKRVAKKRGEKLKVLGKNPNHREPDALYKLGFQGGKGDGLLTQAQNEWSGWGNALKPAYEPIIMARKKFRGSLTDNVLEHGTGGLNIDATRVGSEVMPAIETKTETTEIGWEKKSYITPEKKGRHPANIMLSHSEGCKLVGETEETIIGGNKGKSGFAEGYESGDFTKKQSKVELWDCEDDCPIKLLDTQAPAVGNVAKAKRKKDTTGGSGNSWTNGGKKAGEDNGIYDGLAGASRFFYCPKVSKKERNLGCEDLEDKTFVLNESIRDQSRLEGGVEGDLGWNRAKIRKNHHPTIKPVALMKWLVKLVSVEGQTILDPFAGSGSTGIACALLDREFIGTELDPDYCDIAKGRIKWWKENEK